MKRLFAIIPMLAFSVALIHGCGGKKAVNDDISGKAAEAEPQAQDSAVVVPEDAPVSEAVTAEDLLGPAKTGGKYASLAPGDTLTLQAEKEGRLYTIYFDYDTYFIRDADKDNLSNNAKWLSLNSRVAVRIEGHADERGETEYNLALSDKRARSVKKFLEDMGVRAERLDAISFGEEKPAVPGHDEEAWAKNRRAEFMITRTN